MLPALPAQDLRSPLYLNFDHATPDGFRPAVTYQPAIAALPGGPLLLAWTAYSHGRERIMSTSIRGAVPTRSMLSPGEGIYYWPAIAAAGPDSAWAFWSRFDGGAWQLLARRYERGRWLPVEILSRAGANAFRPSAHGANGAVVVAWESQEAGQWAIASRVWSMGAWSAETVLSPPGESAFRPSLAADGDGSRFVFWDSYRDRRYRVYGRKSWPAQGAIEAVSATSAGALRPTAVFAKDTGLVVAWLARRDVTAAEGVIDQWFTVQAAARRGGHWVQLEHQGSRDIADLRHSLLPEVEPKVIGLYGYQGRRRHPMLVADGGAAWLLWERRIVHDGRGDTAGELCGRRLDGAGWGAPRLLHRGLLDYRVEAAAKAVNGKLTAVAKGLPQDYRAFEIDLTQGRDFAFGQWPGWKPIDVAARPQPPRQSIQADGVTYSLHWADLHVHSGLTPDAEGEPDELLHFARDEARLDAVVIQENDFIGRALTEGEYRYSVHMSRSFAEPGRFVSLPGFEWTHRGHDNKPNHRTVIYAGAETPIVRHSENRANFNELCDAVEAAGGVMNTQHEVYRLTSRACEGNIETASGWRAFIRNPEKIHADLSAGYKVGFVATSDGHRRNPGIGGGLTAIWAERLTPESILDAIRRHRVYATNGTRVFIDARANGVLMGQDVAADGEVRLTLRVESPKPVVKAVLIRDGSEIHARPRRAASLSEDWTDRPGPGFHWYYWRIELEGSSPDYPANIKIAEGNLAWSSPHRVTVRPPR